jgi:(S)-2-hydroxyglutarate dehydrogenase
VFDFLIVGAGVVGLATALNLLEKFPRGRLMLLEKEPALCSHQSGRNSGVIHSGIYYKPGSFKAEFCRAGNQSMVEFCRQYDIPNEICGKLIVATHESELLGLKKLFERGVANGIAPQKIYREQLREIEPHVNGIAAIRIPSAGITNYRRVCEKLAELIRARGGEIRLYTRVRRIRPTSRGHCVETTAGDFETRFLVNCTGLHSDRVTCEAGAQVQAKIIPFRGEYYELKPEKRSLVKGLVYPVPNPSLPFLGVHCTRMIDGSVHLGPNAVLAFKREGYGKTDFSLRDMVETFTYGGFWKLARKHAGEGFREMARSLSKAAFVRSVQRLVPEITQDDVVPCAAGVRAQALAPDGSLVDDFLLVHAPNAIHVCNAPSPAATASLEIGRHIAGLVSGTIESR